MMAPWQAIWQVLFPSVCAACGEVLVSGERHLCLSCMGALRETLSGDQPDNPTERQLMGRIPLRAAMSLYQFRKGNTVQSVVHAMKFRGDAELCLMIGRQMGLAMVASGRFDDVDVLVPVPLHWWRRLLRGYNQSELLCRGIAQVMPRPVVTQAVVRHRYTRKQSVISAASRQVNVDGAFLVRRPEALEGKHVLLVDDVVTTGATLTACADAMASVRGISFSVATMCLA